MGTAVATTLVDSNLALELLGWFDLAGTCVSIVAVLLLAAQRAYLSVRRRSAPSPGACSSTELPAEHAVSQPLLDVPQPITEEDRVGHPRVQRRSSTIHSLPVVTDAGLL